MYLGPLWTKDRFLIVVVRLFGKRKITKRARYFSFYLGTVRNRAVAFIADLGIICKIVLIADTVIWFCIILERCLIRMKVVDQEL